jgi:hypothetical protein
MAKIDTTQTGQVRVFARFGRDGDRRETGRAEGRRCEISARGL